MSKAIFTSQTSYIFVKSCQTKYFFRNWSLKIATLQRLKNQIFQYYPFLTPTSSTLNLPIWASWHVLYQKMYLLFMGKKIETLDFVDLFSLGAILAFKVSQPTKLELKNSPKSKFPVFKPLYLGNFLGSIYEKIPCLTCWNKNVWSLWTKNAFGHKFICKNSVFIAPYITSFNKKDPVGLETSNNQQSYIWTNYVRNRRYVK